MSPTAASCSCDRRTSHRLRAAVVTASLALTACGVADARSTTVEMHDANRYSPSTIRIRVGESVVWSNASDHVHTVSTEQETAPSVGVPDGADTFDSGPIEPGRTYSRRFDVPGVYVFGCDIHGDAGMLGVVSVTR